MRTFLTVLFLFVLFDFESILAQPVGFGKEETRECYGFTCPAGTVACKKVTKTTENGKSLLTQVECQNGGGDVLDEHSKTELNPFGSGTQFTSYSFTGNYHYSSGSSPNSNSRNEVNNNHYHNYNNEVETF